MLALPFAVFVAWRLMAPNAGPPRVLVIGVSSTVAVMLILLLAFWYTEAQAPGTRYVPAQLLNNGQILPPREEPVPR
jgi:hypothetical protein